MNAPYTPPRGKILVVDDTPANLVAMRRLLARMECDIVEAANGNEALSACLDHEFALILLDVQMPEMDGFEVATLLSENEHTTSTPIIFVTAAYKDDMNRLQGYKVGAVDYIAKPINEFILLSKVKVFLDLYRSRCALAAAEAHARHQSMHDALTGLPNRVLFADRLDGALLRAEREQQLMALVYVDIDRFKPVNDRHGHQAGDVLLKAIADRLRGLFRAADTAARLGGDEFAVILESVTTEDQVNALCALLTQEIERPFDLDVPGRPEPIRVDVGASLGIAIYPRDGAQVDELIRVADAQMYRNKHNGRQAVSRG